MQAKRTRARDSRGRPVPGLYLRDGVYSAGFKQDGRWRMVNLDARTLTEARRERESLLSGLREGRVSAPTALTFEATFLDWQDSRRLAPRTREHERYVLDRHLGALKRRRLTDVTPHEPARLLRQIRDTHSEWSRVQVYRVLRGTFAHALRRGDLARNPMDGLAPAERPKQRNAKAVARLEPATLDRLVRAGATVRWQAALALAAWAGLRIGELRGLQWGDVDLDAGVLHVHRSLGRDGIARQPKTQAGVRAVPLLPALRRMLVAWKLEAPHSLDGDLVICTATGEPVLERNARRALDSAKLRAGLTDRDERLSWHSLRHSCASLLATELDLPATTLAAIIGHADAGFTLRVYARDARDTGAVVADVLSRAHAAGVGS